MVNTLQNTSNVQIGTEVTTLAMHWTVTDTCNFLFLVEMSGFALGNVVYIILEIQFQMSATTVSCSGTYGWTFVFRLVFIVAQTFFLFKNQTVRSLSCNSLQRKKERKYVIIWEIESRGYTRQLIGRELNKTRHSFLVRMLFDNIQVISFVADFCISALTDMVDLLLFFFFTVCNRCLMWRCCCELYMLIYYYNFVFNLY